MRLYRKGVADKVAWGIMITAVILVSGAALLMELNKECRKDADCGSKDFYCGSDFSCHEKEIVVKTEIRQDYTIPAYVLAIAIMIAAIILRSKDIKFKLPERPKKKTPDEEKREVMKELED
jgi:hypothetical protein